MNRARIAASLLCGVLLAAACGQAPSSRPSVAPGSNGAASATPTPPSVTASPSATPQPTTTPSPEPTTTPGPTPSQSPPQAARVVREGQVSQNLDGTAFPCE